MGARKKVTLIIVSILAGLGLLAFIFGPVLFASIAYPLPEKHRAAVAYWTNDYCKGIASPNFLSALIMTESGWREDARSYAGAVGMTQFIPSTARAVAQRLGVSPFSPEDLTRDPDMAIRFGAYYICGRIRDYGGDIRKGLIAYNGGGGAVLAFERGTPVRGTVAYADKILNIEKAYDSIYGNWWETASSSSGSSSGSNSSGTDFDVQPKTDTSLLVTIPILDFWRNFLSAPVAEDEPQEEDSGAINSLWQLFLPGSN